MASKSTELDLKSKIEKAFELKNEGNNYFKEKGYQAAIRKYHNALLHVKGLLDRNQTVQALEALLPDASSQTPDDDDKKKIKDLELTCYNNLAACLLKKERYERALEYAKKALNIEDTNLKALFRKATSNYYLRNFEDAERDFKTVFAENPKDISVQKYLKQIEFQKQKAIVKQKQMYSKMF